MDFNPDDTAQQLALFGPQPSTLTCRTCPMLRDAPNDGGALHECLADGLGGWRRPTRLDDRPVWCPAMRNTLRCRK